MKDVMQLAQEWAGRSQKKKTKSGLPKAAKQTNGNDKPSKKSSFAKAYHKHMSTVRQVLTDIGYTIEERVREDGHAVMEIVDTFGHPIGGLPYIIPFSSKWARNYMSPDMTAPFNKDEREFPSDDSWEKDANVGLNVVGLVQGLVKNTKAGPRRKFFKIDSSRPLDLKYWVMDNVPDPFWRNVEELQKIGPASGTDLKRFIQGIVEYYDATSKYEPNRQILTESIQEAVDELISANGGDVIKPIPGVESIGEVGGMTTDELSELISKFQESKENVLGFMTLDSFKGFPHLKTELTEVSQWADYFAGAEAIWDGTARTDIPVIIGSRRQASTVNEAGEVVKEKWRSTYMGSFAEFLAGRKIFTPLLAAMKKCTPYFGYNGVHTLEETVRNGFEECLTSNEKFFIVSLDPSGYDKSLIHLLEEDVLWDELCRLSPASETYFRWCQRYYTRCPLIGPGGIWHGRHGLFSGCLLTSFIGSFLNRIMYIVMRKELGVRDVLHMCMGDDTVVMCTYQGDDITLKDVANVYSRYGINVDNDVRKSAWFDYSVEHSTDMYVTFMGRYFRWNPENVDDCKPVFSLVRCLSSLLFPENLSEPEHLLFEACGDRFGKIEVVGKDGNSLTREVILQFVCTIMNCEFHPYNGFFVERLVNAESHRFNVSSGWVDHTHENVARIKSLGAHVDYQVVESKGLMGVKIVQTILYHCENSPMERVLLSDLLGQVKPIPSESVPADDIESQLDKLEENVIRGNVITQLLKQL
jgi:hypothetical protein